MSDEITTEFQARMKSISMEFLGSRKVSGDLVLQMMFSLLSLLRSKNKITDKDLDIIFEVEKESIAAMLQEYFSHTYGDRNARIQNEEELKIVSRFAFSEMDNYREQIADAARNLKTPRKPRKKENEESNEADAKAERGKGKTGRKQTAAHDSEA